MDGRIYGNQSKTVNRSYFCAKIVAPAQLPGKGKRDG
nr:MAG TPA: hypothetical protein [Bacteriophage sp.]